MIERYVLPEKSEVEAAFTVTQPWWTFTASFNVAPGRYVPVLRLHEGCSEGVMMRWGLIPAAAEGEPPARRTHTVAAGEMLGADDYRGPWLQGQRCIVPLGGFYLWQRTAKRYLQPYFVQLAERGVFGVAAVWERSVTEQDEVIESCALIMAPPGAAELRIDGACVPLPAILERNAHESWLRATPAEAMQLLGRLRLPTLRHHPVSPRVNVPELDDSSLIAPVEPETFELGASFCPPPTTR